MLNDIGLLVARSTVGLALASHGAQKAFGWFGGSGPTGAAQFMEGVGLRPGERFAKAASYTELAAGTLMTLGFLGSLGPALVLSVQTVAAVSANAKNGFYAGKGGVELNTMYGAAALALAVAGPGRYSLDRVLGLDGLQKPIPSWLTLAGGIGGAIFILSQRTAKAVTATGAEPARSTNGTRRETPATS